MKGFLAIMDWDGGNRVAKYQDFDVEAEALAHVTAHLSKYHNAFVIAKPNDSFTSWLVDPVANTLSVDFPVIIPSTDAERIEQAFTLGDKDHVIKAMFLEFENRISALEGGAVKSEIETLLEAKLP